jgi:chromate transporter
MNTPSTTATPTTTTMVTFAQAFAFWLKLGFISFGGPAGQIAIMHKVLVEEKRWISEARFLHALNYCMLLPGPEAQQLATYIGWLMHRTWGGVVAGALFVLPSLFILIGLSWMYVTYGEVSWVAGLLYGLKPAVAALVVHAVHRMGSKILKNPRQTPVFAAIAVLSFVALYFFHVPFPWVVLVAGLVGSLGARWMPQQFQLAAAKHSANNAQSTQGSYLIDDQTPTPAHARFARGRLARVLVVGALLWLLPFALLVAWQGWDSTLADMALFFSKAALLTFGGAYAVLPYVFQGAVEEFHWLTALQMMDGLALGETTPGPLIMVVAFVGYLGGHHHQVLGPDALFWGASLAAAVVTWFTFLPSFIFILAGGPVVESTHGKLHFTAPLAAISAAVVGVVASLAMFFIAHMAINTTAIGQFGSKIDWIALVLALRAVLALVRFKRNVMEVLLVSALLGLAVKTLGWV